MINPIAAALASKAPAARLPIRTRVMCTANPTPIAVPNVYYVGTTEAIDKNGNARFLRDEPIVSFMSTLGYEKTFMVYNGTLNRGGIWTALGTDNNRHLITLPQLDNYDWSKEGNYSDPLDPAMAFAMGELAMNPNQFWQTGMNIAAPVFFDIEATKELTVSPSSPLANRVNAINKWTTMIQQVRAGAQHWEQEIYVYGDPWTYQAVLPDQPEPEILNALDKFKSVVSGVTPCMYFWDPMSYNLNYWHYMIGASERFIGKWCPEFKRTKIAVVNPNYQIYWNDPNKLNNTPIPLNAWMSLIDKLVLEGYWILVWTGPVKYDNIASHLRYVANYIAS